MRCLSVLPICCLALLGVLPIGERPVADAAGVSVKEAPPEALPPRLGLSDEAAVNLRVVNRRWPDCTTLASAVPPKNTIRAFWGPCFRPGCRCQVALGHP